MITTRIDEHAGAALRAATMDRAPWAHAYVRDTLPADVLHALSSTFGEIETTSAEETGRDKSYRFATARLDGAGVTLPNEPWRALVAFLHGDEYRAAIERLTGVDLVGCDTTVSVWEYGGGDWLAPHVDKPEKVVTHILYFTEAWAEGDGGRLLILEDDVPTSVARALPPVLGAGAVLVRSETSWHAVEPPAPASAPRRSVTATFWRTGA